MFDVRLIQYRLVTFHVHQSSARGNPERFNVTKQVRQCHDLTKMKSTRKTRWKRFTATHSFWFHNLRFRPFPIFLNKRIINYRYLSVRIEKEKTQSLTRNPWPPPVKWWVIRDLWNRFFFCNTLKTKILLKQFAPQFIFHELYLGRWEFPPPAPLPPFENTSMAADINRKEQRTKQKQTLTK